MLKYCTNCVMPSTKPDLSFNDLGICSACTAYENRIHIDWAERELEFVRVMNEYRDKNGKSWDCLIPVSGGKDSTCQVLKVLEYGFRPLCVTSTTCDQTEIGRRNLLNIRELGVDCMEMSPNPKVRRQLNRLGLIEVGDISWPEHVGIFTIPIRIATAFKIPLIIWGENSQHEYGGPAVSQDSKILDRRWLEEFGGLLGLRVSDIPEFAKITEADLSSYSYPSNEELLEAGVTGLFLGYYFPWDGLANALVAQANGFETYGKSVEGSIVDYENLDNFQTGIHDYFKFLKYGFGRASDIASLHIRRGRISRTQGMRMVIEHDGKFPATYLGRSLNKIIEPLGITEDHFRKICDQFTNEDLFVTDSQGNLVRDSSGSLVKINYDNQ